MSQRSGSLGGDEGTLFKVPSTGVLGDVKSPKEGEARTNPNTNCIIPAPQDWGVGGLIQRTAIGTASLTIASSHPENQKKSLSLQKNRKNNRKIIVLFKES